MIYARVIHAVSGLFCCVLMYFMSVAPAHAVFINEIHYDNAGADTDEGVELSGEAGFDLSGWSLVLYNGSTSSPYSSGIALSGVFANMENGMGVLDFGISGLQNGGSDGIALVDNLGTVTQFLSYEGTITAGSGVASGLISSDIGVAETPSTLAGYSLQLIGSGREYADFSWAAQPIQSTFAGINFGQAFYAPTVVSRLPRSASVPVPSSWTLFLLGLCLCVVMRQCGFGARPMMSQV